MCDTFLIVKDASNGDPLYNDFYVLKSMIQYEFNVISTK